MDFLHWKAVTFLVCILLHFYFTLYILYEVKELKDRYKSHDPFEIADHMNIHVTYDNLGSLKGYYFYQSRFRYIVINENMTDRYKNIICAHEIGHDRLHQHFARNNSIWEFSLFDMSSKPEREANLFTTELLISDEVILKYVDQQTTYNMIAAELGAPVELVVFKSQILNYKGYDLKPLEPAKWNFLQ